ncbi:hypothetical protein D3C78_1149970 [compost metagenome]
MTGIALIARRFGIKRPELRQLAISPVIGNEHHSCIVAPLHNNTRSFAIQIGDSSQESVNTIAVAVAPIRHISTLWLIGRCRKLPARCAFKYSMKFRPFQYISAGIAVICIRIADYMALTVNRAVGCPEGNLCLAVAIKIIRHNIEIMCS